MIHNVDPQLSQWDVGRIVSISDSNATHIHFANQGDSKAVIMEITDGSAKIPDYLLQTGKTVIAYAVLDGVTLESKSFSVRKRERPENYVYEDDQRNYIYELISDVETAVANANQATANANTATESATIATANANVATNSANLATTNANNAAENANIATQKTTEAVAKANNAVKNMMIVGGAEGENISLDNAIDQTLVGLRVFGKTTQDGTPTPDAPVDLVSAGEDGGSIDVSVIGKNLIPPTTIASGFVGNGDGTYTVADLSKNTNTIGSFTLYAGKQYTLSATRISGSGLLPCLIFRKEDGTNLKTNYVDTNLPVVVTQTETETVKIILQAGSAKGNCSVGDKFAIQMENGPTATAYEPYKSQQLPISTHNCLPGIPVTSGGNYTDANGQQWICDEIDFARGVYVQRVYRKKLTNVDGIKRAESGFGYRFAYTTPNLVQSNTTNGSYSLCDSLPLAGYGGTFSVPNSYTVNGVEIMIALTGNETLDELADYLADKPIEVQALFVEPIKTPLSKEELAAYANLHTYKDNTTVSNDAGAWMDLEYVMDAKKYIDSLVGTGGSIIPATVE